MEGSSPATAAHFNTVRNHPFLMDYGSRLAPQTSLRDLLAHVVHPDPLQVLASSPLGSHHRSGVTTRSVSYRSQTRLATTRMDGTPSSTSSIPHFGTPTSMSSLPLFAAEASVAMAQETRKRRAGGTKTTGLATKKRRAETTPKATDLKAPPVSESSPESAKPSYPAGLKNDSDYGEDNSTPNCCICMCEPEPADLANINGCQHKFCFDCIEKWAEQENTCPLCKIRFSKIDRVNKAKRKKGEPSRRSTKQVKMRDQRSNLPESALEGLVASFAAAGTSFPPQSIAQLLFAGMGASIFEFGPTRLVRTRELRFDNGPRPILFAPTSDLFDEPMMSSDDDEDDTFSGLMRRTRRVPVRSRSIHLAMPTVQRYAQMAAAAAAPPARSYAVNVGESTAGNAHNPLEIEDDSDDEVEVVEVVTTLE